MMLKHSRRPRAQLMPGLEIQRGTLLGLSVHRHLAARERRSVRGLVIAGALTLGAFLLFLHPPTIGVQREAWGIALNGNPPTGVEQHWTIVLLCKICFLVCGRNLFAFHVAAFVLLWALTTAVFQFASKFIGTTGAWLASGMLLCGPWLDGTITQPQPELLTAMLGVAAFHTWWTASAQSGDLLPGLRSGIFCACAIFVQHAGWIFAIATLVAIVFTRRRSRAGGVSFIIALLSALLVEAVIRAIAGQGFLWRWHTSIAALDPVSNSFAISDPALAPLIVWSCLIFSGFVCALLLKESPGRIFFLWALIVTATCLAIPQIPVLGWDPARARHSLVLASPVWAITAALGAMGLWELANTGTFLRRWNLDVMASQHSVLFGAFIGVLLLVGANREYNDLRSFDALAASMRRLQSGDLVHAAPSVRDTLTLADAKRATDAQWETMDFPSRTLSCAEIAFVKSGKSWIAKERSPGAAAHE
jgi:hypothetical protein